MKKVVCEGEARILINSYKKDGENGLLKIREYLKLIGFIEDVGLSYYEIIHCLSRIANPNYGKRIVYNEKQQKI